MPSKVTYTGKIGPGIDLQTVVFPDVRRFALDFEKRTLQLNYVRNGDPEEAILDMSDTVISLTDTVDSDYNHDITIALGT